MNEPTLLDELLPPANRQPSTVEPADPAPCELCGRPCSARTDGRHAHPVCVRDAP